MIGKRTMTALIGLGIVLVTPVAFACGHMGWDASSMRTMSAGTVDGWNTYLPEDQQLTQAQMKQIRAIQAELKAEATPLVTELRSLYGQAYDSDTGTSAETVARVAELRKKLEDLHADARNRFRAVLTPEQLDYMRPQGWGGPHGNMAYAMGWFADLDDCCWKDAVGLWYGCD